MSEEGAQTVPPTTEDTPAETPAATDDQPAVTEVTEVTEVTTEVTITEGESETTPKEEAPKEEPPKEEPKEEVKEKPKPPPAKVVDYRTSKAGWVQKQGLIFKKWQRQYMSLDEEDSVLRWWKTDVRTGSDGALFMKYCADVSDPKPEATTTWPADTTDRCFVVSSPYRAFFLVAESADDKNDWVQRLTAAKEKHNTDGHKVITNELISVEGFKAATFGSGATDLDKTVEDEEIVKEEGAKTEDAPPTEGEQTATTEPAETPVAVTVEVDVETPAEEPPKEETPKVEEPPKEETPVEEPPKDETPTEESPAETPKDETPSEEPKDETPAATEGGEADAKAED